MRKRQAQQGRRLLAPRTAEQVPGVLDRIGRGRKHVAVGKHAPLGYPGGTTGVHNRRKVVGTHRATTIVVRGVQQPVLIAVVPGLDRLQQPDIGPQATTADLAELGPLRLGLDKTPACSGIGEDVLNLQFRSCRVDRNRDRTDTENREIDDRPLIAGSAQHGHAVAVRDAMGQQHLGNGPDVLGELPAGEILPTGSGLPTEHTAVRVQPDAFIYQ